MSLSVSLDQRTFSAYAAAGGPSEPSCSLPPSFFQKKTLVGYTCTFLPLRDIERLSSTCKYFQMSFQKLLPGLASSYGITDELLGVSPGDTTDTKIAALKSFLNEMGFRGSILKQLQCFTEEGDALLDLCKSPSFPFGGELLACLRANGFEGQTFAAIEGEVQASREKRALYVKICHDWMGDPKSSIHTVTTLKCCHCHLKALPYAICKLVNLTSVNFSLNQLTHLPDNFGNLSKLTTLELYANQLTSLPESIGNLVNLTKLVIFRNKFDTFPAIIFKLRELELLNISQNLFICLPEAIGSLKKLTSLILSNNKLTALPASIGQLEKLTWLDLGMNELTSLPDSVGNLDQLTNLFLQNNQFDSFADIINVLGDHIRLENLFVADNLFTSAPETIGDYVKQGEEGDFYYCHMSTVD